MVGLNMCPGEYYMVDPNRIIQYVTLCSEEKLYDARNKILLLVAIGPAYYNEDDGIKMTFLTDGIFVYDSGTKKALENRFVHAV